ncbi:MAG: hypothetical protein ACXIVO_02760 [Glycocaulis sp.]
MTSVEKHYADFCWVIKMRIKNLDVCLAQYPEGLFETESIALQLRKLIEGVFFASLIPNGEGLNLSKTKLGKLWRINEILEKIKSINPNYYPKRYKIIQCDSDDTMKRMEFIENKIDEADLLAFHGRLGVVLHEINPHRQSNDFNWVREEAKGLLQDLAEQMWNHVVTSTTGDVFIASFNEFSSDDVRVQKAEPADNSEMKRKFENWFAEEGLADLPWGDKL